MFLISLLIVNIAFAIIIRIYCKLTTGICKCSRHLVGKVVIVTGGNAGIGYETAKDLAARGARVIIACRNESRGITACANIIASTGNNDVHYRHLDLASLASVRTFAEGIIKTEKRLDVLINNAGIFDHKNEKTPDGLSLVMQTNHFGPFLLTNLLLPLLEKSAPSRIINVSSLAHRSGMIDFNNLNFEKETPDTYEKRRAYGTTKLCNILMTVELAKRLDRKKVTANSLHPGVDATDIFANVLKGPLKHFQPLLRYILKTPWEGAQTSIYLAVSPEVDGESGKYYSDCRESNTTKPAQDKDLAHKLWEISEELVSLKKKSR